MPQIGEGRAKVKFKQDDPNDDRKKINIRVGVFFDGTLNNSTNISQRLLSAQDDDLTPEEREVAANLKRNASDQDIEAAKTTYAEYGEPGADNSYEGYYTNVVKLDRYVNTKKGKTKGYEITLKTYIEGSGTLDKEDDIQNGFAFAMGKSGVPAKVAKGIENVVQLINDAQKNKKEVIELLTLDVFGFSRGAAGARKFINDALFGRRFVLAGGSLGGPDPSTSIRAQLARAGYTISSPGAKTGVKICFAGLFDTVSTYGVGVLIDEDDNVDALSLNAVFHAEETLHLTAADEHRYHFSLTDIKSAGGRGKQVFLPGVHSDIGGGYRDMAKEDQPILGSIGLKNAFLLQSCDIGPKEAEADEKTLIAAGWYRKDEVTLENHDYYFTSPGMEKSHVPPQLVERRVEKVERSGIRNTYSTIPLQIMAKAARSKGLVIESKFDRDEAVPDELSNVHEEIQRYVNKHGPDSSKPADWHDNDREWLRKLRHQYFHFSARMMPGHDPRIIDGKRIRKVYRG